VSGAKNEAFKIEFAHTTQFRPRLEVHISVVANAVVTFEKSDFRIEIGANVAMLGQPFEPAILVANAGT
jgi:hypothetical protein